VQIQDGDSVFIGSGSTTTLLARKLTDRKHLTVITNALNIAAELSAYEDHITVIVTGGVLRGSELSVLGHIAEQSLQEVRVDKIFMGAQALSLDGGWTTDHMPEVQTTRKVLEMARELILVADHAKIGIKAAAYIAPLKRIGTLITDTQANSAFVERATELGVRVLQV
jgi:DeoR/GlpR family transcriptional regulator of sugar metabolism